MRELELIYQLYEEEFEPVEFKDEIKLSDEQKEKIFNLFKQSPAKQKNSKKSIKEGNIYLMFINQVPVYYVLFEKIGELYEVVKASKWVELGAHNDFLVKVDDEWFLIETWNRFYLKEEEIKNHILIGKLDNQDMLILVDILENDAKIPAHRKGLEVDLLDDNYFQTKFHKKESEIVYEYKTRLFTEILAEDEEESEVVYLEPERVSDFKLTQLAASKTIHATQREDFILSYNEDIDAIEIHVYKYAGKKGIVEIAGQRVEYEQIPEIIYIDSTAELKNIDIEKLADSIKIEVEN